MISDGKITIDPQLVIRCGDHRYRVSGWRWICDRCGTVTNPAHRFTDCAAGPVE